VLVGKEDVDLVSHEREEVGAVPFDAERIRQSERDATPRVVGVLGGDAEGLLCVVLVEEVPLEEDHRRRLHGFAGDVPRGEHRPRAEEGVHRALSIGRDGDDTAPRRLVMIERRGEKLHPGAREIGGKHPTELVVGDLADEPRAGSETRHSVTGIGRRSTAGLDALADSGVEEVGTLRIDEHHRCLHHVVGNEEPFVYGCDDVDHRIADGHCIETRLC
jgi:hypothetical protein